MKKHVLTAFIVALVLALTSAAAFAEAFELGQIKVGGGVSYGVLTISDNWNSDRYSSLAPVVGVNASYELFPNVKLLANYSLCIEALTKPVGAEWDGGSEDFADSNYTNLSLAASIALTDNIDLIAGWTRFTSGYTYTWEDPYFYEIRNVGSGLKIGAAVNIPLTKALTLDASYAFLPKVRSITFANGEQYNDSYVGRGHELEARVTYVTPFSLGVTLGFRSGLYDGRFEDYDGSYYEEFDLASFSAGTLGVSYSF